MAVTTHYREDSPLRQKRPEEKVELKQNVGVWGGVSLIVGVIIGSGIFISPTGVLSGAGSVGLSLIIWALCGLISMMGALAEAELGTMIPQSGGDYTYLREAFGLWAAFLHSWASVLLLRPAGIAIIALSCAEYSMYLFFNDSCGRAPELIIKLTAAVIIAFLGAVNAYSVVWANRINIFTTIAKISSLIIIIIGGIIMLAKGHTQYLQDSFRNTQTNIGSIVMSFYSGMWAYDGWNNLNFVTEEVINPARTLPLAIMVSIPMVTVLYILVNISYFSVLSPQQILASYAVGVSWAKEILPQVPWLMPLFVGLSTLGATNGTMFSGGRQSYVAARDGNMVGILSMVHIRRMTPLPALIFTNLIAILMVIPSQIGALIDLFSFSAWTYYGATMLSLLVMRWTRRHDPRPYKVFVGFPILILLVSIFLVFTAIISDPKVEYIFAALAIAAGLLFYFPLVYFKKKLPGTDYITAKLQLFLEVIPEEKDL